MYIVFSFRTKIFNVYFAPCVGLSTISQSAFFSTGFEVIYSIVILVDVNPERFKWMYNS